MNPRFAGAVVGVYATFLTWGVLQERVSSTPYVAAHGDAHQYFRFFIVLNLAQALAAAAVARVYALARGRAHAPLDWPLLRRFLRVGFLSAAGSPFGYASLRHIDYPTMILGKSCKLVPVLLMSVVAFGQRYPPLKYASVALITVGVSLFMLLHENEQATSHKRANSAYGLLLLGVNLFIDGVTNATQDRIFREHKRVTGEQMMIMMNLCSAACMAAYLVLWPFTTELTDAAVFVRQFPSIVPDVALFCLCGALGQIFIFDVLEHFGSMSLVMVTVTRKLFTILLSVAWFGHHLSAAQFLCVGLVFAGIALDAQLGRAKKAKKSARARE